MPSSAINLSDRRPPALPQSPPAATERDDARMFDLAPVSLWLEDYSGLRALFATWRAQGVADLRAHLAADPAHLAACSQAIRVVKVNRRTLHLFEAEDLPTLVANLDRIFRDDMLTAFIGNWSSSGTARRRFPATPSTTRSPAAGSTSSSRAPSCPAMRRPGRACWWRSRT